MRRFCLVPLLCLVLVAPLSAQEVATSYKTRIAELGRALEKDPTSVQALYNLAQFYFDNSHPMRNLPVAMRYATQAEEQHAYLLKHDKVNELLKLQRNDITLGNIHQLRESIAEAAMVTARSRSNMSLAEIDDYLETFSFNQELAKLMRARRLSLIYKQTLDNGTPEECYSFMTSYEGSSEAEEMEQYLTNIVERNISGMSTEEEVDNYISKYPKSRAIKAIGNKYKSRIAFADAQKIGNLNAYNQFLAKYPTSDESELARKRIDRLLEVDLSHRTSAMQLAQFADSNADSPLADRALAKMRKIIYRTHDIEAARYYVEHYTLDAHANEVYGEYYSWYAVEGNAGPLNLFSEQNPDFPFQRALESDLEKGDYIDRIDLTRPYHDSAYAEYAGYVNDFSGKPIAVVPLQRMLQKPYASRNYASAIAVVKDMETYFDNNYRGQYESLLQLLGTPHAAHQSYCELADSTNILHPVVNPDDGMLYYSDGTQICRALRKGASWVVTDTVRFINSDVQGLMVFSFFDNGRHMLLGNAGDIWIAELDTDGWRISDIPPYPVNTDYIETDAYMLPDGSGLLLASDRPGGLNCQPSGMNFHGDTALATDLYYIPITRHGWGDPVNLGLSVNSVYSERSPIMSRNLHTLYYISDAHTGLGYGDIYVTERTNPDDWTSWSRPRNLGREVNSPWREESISFSPDEKRIHFSSNFGGDNFKAYSFATTHSTASGSRTFQVDVADASPTLLRLQVADMQQQVVTQVMDYNQDDSLLSLNLDKNHTYALLADAGNRFVTAEVLTPENRTAYRLPAYTYSELVSMDRALPLPIVTFRRGENTPSQVAQLQLEQLARFLSLYPHSTVEIQVDVAGTDATQCYRLSLQRADAVRNCLTQNGIPSEHIILSAYGNSRTKTGVAEGVSVRFRE